MNLKFLSTRIGGWAISEVILAIVVALVVVTPLTSKVSYSGTWDGDPSMHNHFVMDAVNIFVQEYKHGGDPLRGFLQCYYRFPKMLHDILLAIVILMVHGNKPVAFSDVERYGAWFSTIWTLVGVLAIYLFLRHFFPRLICLAVVPIVGLCGYILLYANFPRQNMPAHALSWLALLAYVHYRTRYSTLPPAGICAVGLSWGAAVAVHYSSTYLFFTFVVSELAIGVRERNLRSSLISLGLMFGTACAVWFAVDLYYYLYILKYPNETNWRGEGIRGNSFLEGMVYSHERIQSHIALSKLESTKWWFLPGLLYRSLGIMGTLMMGVGTLYVVGEWRQTRRGGDSLRIRAWIILGAGLLVTIVTSLEYFQNARKLMVFYPFWCALLGLGFRQSVAFLTWLPAWIGKREFQQPKQLPKDALLVVASLALIITHFALFYPAARDIFIARRDTGYMREYLVQHGITRVLVIPTLLDSPMAPVETNLKNLTMREADGFGYLVTNRLYPSTYTEEFMRQIRDVRPIVSFRNQVSLPLFWYEFPLKKGFIDASDGLSSNRNLYRWKDVREYCRRFLKADK